MITMELKSVNDPGPAEIQTPALVVQHRHTSSPNQCGVQHELFFCKNLTDQADLN